MIDDLKESLGEAGLSDLISTMLHPLLVARQEIRKVNDGRDLVGRHSDEFDFRKVGMGS